MSTINRPRVNFYLLIRLDMDVHDSIQQAKKAASQDDIATAQKILKQVISEEPKNVEAWLILADSV